MSVRSCAVCMLLLLSCGPPAAACNPDPPRPPILDGYPYDATAAAQLLADASSVVAARLALRLDVELEGPGEAGAGGSRADYVFEVLEGWKAETPRRVTVGSHWVPCGLGMRSGRVFLLYLDGVRLLHAVPVEQLDFELPLLGEPDWFYDARGRWVSTGEE